MAHCGSGGPERELAAHVVVQLVAHVGAGVECLLHGAFGVTGAPQVGVGAGLDRGQPHVSRGADAAERFRDVDVAHGGRRAAVPVGQVRQYAVRVGLERPVLDGLPVHGGGSGELGGRTEHAQVERGHRQQGPGLPGRQVEALLLPWPLRALQLVLHVQQKGFCAPERRDGVGRLVVHCQRLHVVVDLVQRHVWQMGGGGVSGVGGGVTSSHGDIAFVERWVQGDRCLRDGRE
ncbi:hypothetical protein [Streptomyces sp. NPDC056690]|uniref:hypothetical protein n=1 Tax=Streptomyces sp. NPDC056690 TaxID=3345912 RepID=UPI0036BBDB9C